MRARDRGREEGRKEEGLTVYTDGERERETEGERDGGRERETEVDLMD